MGSRLRGRLTPLAGAESRKQKKKQKTLKCKSVFKRICEWVNVIALGTLVLLKRRHACTVHLPFESDTFGLSERLCKMIYNIRTFCYE